ncbi:MAG: dTDP-4-dehydrorhamnose 3,5-epimerase [Burkholderiales bacterium]
MIFTETRLKGAFIVDPELKSDDRGFFFRTWCRQEFNAHGLDVRLAQCSGVFNKKKGTLRGMHWQAAPRAEAKLIRVISGGVYDVIADLRPQSATYLQWVSLELNSDNRRMLFVPTGFAHGYLTLTDDTELFYQMSEIYSPECARGFRWNDPAFAIDWPGEALAISERDLKFPDFMANERHLA